MTFEGTIILYLVRLEANGTVCDDCAERDFFRDETVEIHLSYRSALDAFKRYIERNEFFDFDVEEVDKATLTLEGWRCPDFGSADWSCTYEEVDLLKEWGRE